MSDLKNRLIKIGEENPNLQKHLRPVLDRISSSGESNEGKYREEWLEGEDKMQEKGVIVSSQTSRSAANPHKDLIPSVDLDNAIEFLDKIGGTIWDKFIEGDKLERKDPAQDSYYILEDALRQAKRVQELRDGRGDMDEVSEEYDLLLDSLNHLRGILNDLSREFRDQGNHHYFRKVNNWIQSLRHHRQELERYKKDIDRGEVKTIPV